MSFFNVKMSIASAILALGACGAHRPPQELVDARVAYSTAADGNAGKLVPAELHDARTALDRAEREFDDDGGSQEAKDLSYIALRKAQRAEALGNASAAIAAKSSMDRSIGKTQEAIIENQQGALRSREEQLNKKQAELQNQVAMTEAERTARAKADADRLAAEQKAKDAMDALARSLEVKKNERGTVITLSGGVLFATNKADILPGAQAQLNQVADVLKSQAEQHFTIEGHTDNTGTDAVNRDLSQRRAAAVKDYLTVRGVSPNAFTVLGSGSSRPVADNKSVEGRAMNRRVEIIVGPSTESAQR